MTTWFFHASCKKSMTTHMFAILLYRLSADAGALVGLSLTPGEPSPGSSPLQSPAPSACPFPIPPQYEDAKENKVQTVSALRNSINQVRPFLPAAKHCNRIC